MSARITQAEWDANRAERKAKAAVTVAATAEAAKAAKAAALSKGTSLGNEEFLAKARRVESILNGAALEVEKVASDDDVSYEDLKNDELSEMLKERGLPHSGTKDELVARLVESDQAQAASGEESE